MSNWSTSIVSRRGPSHCLSRSASTWARNTRSRGASNSRTISITGSPSGAMISVSWCFVMTLLLVLFGVLLGRHPREHLVEALVTLLDLAPTPFYPSGHQVENLRLQMAGTALGVLRTSDQACLLQHLQVLGDGLDRHVVRRRELGERRVRHGEAGHQVAPSRVGQRGERARELFLVHVRPLLQLIG